MSLRAMPQATKRATNLSVNDSLLKAARQLNINVSATLERALLAEVRQREAALWQEQNRDAIAAYNRSVEDGGVFSDGLRGF